MTFQDLTAITAGKLLHFAGDFPVDRLLFDSRKSVGNPAGGVFFAIKGPHHDGHNYLPELFEAGIRQFVVEYPVDAPGECNMLLVDGSIPAIQKAAAMKRNASPARIIGITGSNGKTIVKEWLYQMLTPSFRVVKSPSSYNSQLGVALSVWELSPLDEIAVFEAGISTMGEMEKLTRVILPDIGIFTNIGSAHDEGFRSMREKISEKMKLFSRVERLIYCRDHELIHDQVNVPSYTWGWHKESDLIILDSENKQGETDLLLSSVNEKIRLSLPVSDRTSVENLMHVVATMHVLGFTWLDINKSIAHLRPLSMRLELKQGVNNCYLIDDTYNNDLAGLKNALDFMNSQPHPGIKTLIVSDILQTGTEEEKLISSVNELALHAGIRQLVGIGRMIYEHQHLFSLPGEFYNNTEEFLQSHPENRFHEALILVKGARPFRFEQIVHRLEARIHRTVLEVDLGALTHNLNFYRSRLEPGVMIMVMVKAFAYGAGSLEIANLLQFHKVSYLGVAYADEGIQLRKNGIQLPIMVMNPSPDSFPAIFENDLEPEVYSFQLLEELTNYLKGQPARIHLKIDTGMKRLGFEIEQTEKLCDLLALHPEWNVVSVFSHLAGADEVRHADFSKQQAAQFQQFCDRLEETLGYRPVRHLLNSAGILRFPEFQLDMVRLGIGLYGVEANHEEQHHLHPVSALFTVVSQIKCLVKGETVGYDRRGVANDDTTIATIAIGYADGFSRAFSNGVGRVYLNGKDVHVIGNVCMDMTMVDVTGLEVSVGDRVEVFGRHVSLNRLAQMIDTIPYEILTNVSQRVKRIYFSD